MMNPNFEFTRVGNEYRIPVSLIATREQLLRAFDARFDQDRTDQFEYAISNDLMMEWAGTEYFDLLYINGLSDHCEALTALVNNLWVEESEAQAQADLKARLLAHLRGYDIRWLAERMQANDRNGSYLDCLDPESPEYGGPEVLLEGIAEFVLEYAPESSVDDVLASLFIPTMASVQEALDADVARYDSLDEEARASAGYPSNLEGGL